MNPVRDGHSRKDDYDGTAVRLTIKDVGSKMQDTRFIYVKFYLSFLFWEDVHQLSSGAISHLK